MSELEISIFNDNVQKELVDRQFCLNAVNTI